MSKPAQKTVISAVRAAQILRAPLITEKATQAAQFNQYGFKVSMDATKPEIKAAVESIFKVSVTKVNTSILPGKQKVFRGRLGQRSDLKKAFVTLKEGQTIDLGTGV